MGIACFVFLGLFTTYKAIFTRRALFISQEACAETTMLHVFVDGEDVSKAMECVCTAFDNAQCPHKLQVHVFVPLQSAAQETEWDANLEYLCASMPTYNTHFAKNIHLHKFNVRKRPTTPRLLGSTLGDLESIDDSEPVFWLPALTRLVRHWDVAVRKEASENITVYPLLKITEAPYDAFVALGLQPSHVDVGYFYIDASMLSFNVRAMHSPREGESLGLSTRHPFVCSKKVLMALSDSPEEDLALSAYVQSLDIKVHHSASQMGQTYWSNLPSREKSRVQLLSVLSKVSPQWLESLAVERVNDDFIVHGRAIMGMSAACNLSEKQSKWGSEAKYESMKSAVLF